MMRAPRCSEVQIIIIMIIVIVMMMMYLPAGIVNFKLNYELVSVDVQWS